MSKIKQFFLGFRKGMKNFGNDIAVIINTALLFVVYFIAVGITSIFAKLTGKRFIRVRELKEEQEVKTYWSDLNLKKRPIEEYYRQF